MYEILSKYFVFYSWITKRRSKFNITFLPIEEGKLLILPIIVLIEASQESEISVVTIFKMNLGQLQYHKSDTGILYRKILHSNFYQE
jgi:hypothetical protein